MLQAIVAGNSQDFQHQTTSTVPKISTQLAETD